MSQTHNSHGHTPAAWTLVVIVTIAFIVGTLGLVLGSWPMFWVGVGLVVLGGVVGKVMQMMGMGAPRRQPAAQGSDS
jgi:uncharacterized membrane protein